VRKALVVVLVFLATLSLAMVGATSQSASGARTSSCASGAVGRLTSVLFPAASVNGVQVSGPTNLKRRYRLTTNQSGHLLFCLNTKNASCDTRRASRVTVFPVPSVLVRFDAGTSSCVTDTSGGTRLWDARGGAVRMRSSDPLFQVEEGANGTLVKVVVGFISVSGRSGDRRSVLVGPLEQVAVPPKGDPLQPTPLVLSTDDQAILAGLAKELPPAPFSRPSAGNSRALTTIFKTKTLVVAIDKPRVMDKGTTPFARRLFGLLAKVWGVNPSFRSFSGTGATLARKGELVISPDASTLRSPEMLPLFTDSKRTVWFVATGSDKELLTAVQQFVTIALNRGQYAAFYKQSFGLLPDYSPLRRAFSAALP
jgi:hypothetical protein